MTPEQFAADAKAWIEAIGSLIVPITSLIGGVLGVWSFLRHRILAERLNDQCDRIDAMQARQSSEPQKTQL